MGMMPFSLVHGVAVGITLVEIGLHPTDRAFVGELVLRLGRSRIVSSNGPRPHFASTILNTAWHSHNESADFVGRFSGQT